MKPRTLQIHLQKELSRLYDAHEAAAIATRYVTDRFGLSTAQLLLNDDVLLSAAEEEQTQRDVEQLLAQVPVQQVVGFEWFCGHRFRVTADTLIPRPETEGLVRLATERCCGALSNILDVGTGSGCIAISLAKILPLARVVAWDISEGALQVAQANATTLGASVDFQLRDVLKEAETPTMLRSLWML